eukprot:tig00022099_g23807.t1
MALEALPPLVIIAGAFSLMGALVGWARGFGGNDRTGKSPYRGGPNPNKMLAPAEVTKWKCNEAVFK